LGLWGCGGATPAQVAANRSTQIRWRRSECFVFDPINNNDLQAPNDCLACPKFPPTISVELPTNPNREPEDPSSIISPWPDLHPICPSPNERFNVHRSFFVRAVIRVIMGMPLMSTASTLCHGDTAVRHTASPSHS
jgi:hypothetical protein